MRFYPAILSELHLCVDMPCNTQEFFSRVRKSPVTEVFLMSEQGCYHFRIGKKNDRGRTYTLICWNLPAIEVEAPS